jgi:hypothetical protein
MNKILPGDAVIFKHRFRDPDDRQWREEEIHGVLFAASGSYSSVKVKNQWYVVRTSDIRKLEPEDDEAHSL